MALKDGNLAGAGLDVLEEEDILKDERGFWFNQQTKENGPEIQTVLMNDVLMDMPNVIVTPHNAFNTKEAITRILDTDISNITKFFSSGTVECPIK